MHDSLPLKLIWWDFCMTKAAVDVGGCIITVYTVMPSCNMAQCNTLLYMWGQEKTIYVVILIKWLDCHHWLTWQLSFWQLPVQPVTKIMSKLWHFYISVWQLFIARRSENDNTPQPLNQWTNSPFIGQQVGVDHPIPEIQQFQYFTLKIPGQDHGWGQSLKSQCESNILSTHSHSQCQWALPSLRYSIFKISPWKSKVKVIAAGQIVGTTPYQLTLLSFDVNETSHSYT